MTPAVLASHDAVGGTHGNHGSYGTHRTDAAPHGPTPAARLFELLRRERRGVALVYLYATLAGLFSLTLPLGVQAVIGLVSGGLFLQPVVLLIAFVVLGTAVSGALQIAQLGVVEAVQQRIFARYALEIGARIPRVQLEHIIGGSGGSLRETTNRFFEVVSIQKSLGKLLTESVTALLQLVFGLVLLTFYHPYFSLFGVVLLAILAAILRLTGARGLETSLAESRYKYRVAGWLQELARMAPAFKFADGSTLPVVRTDDEVAGYLTSRRRHFTILVRQSVAAIAFKTIITGGLLVLGSLLVIDRQITLGQFVASEIVIVTVLAAVEKLILSLGSVYDVLTAVDKLGHLTDLPADASDGPRRGPQAPPAGMSVRARALAYRYPGARRYALRGVELAVGPGERVALTGAEGAGESTLLGVLAGLLPSYEGAIDYDGASARDLHPGLLRDAVALCGPTAELLDGTVEENITLGRSRVSFDDVQWALARAGLAEWVRALPAGLRTRVEAEGDRLPSHVRWKLVLARALAGRPKLLLFDEFFHHLDPDSKEDIIRAVTDPAAGWTVIAASHDPLFIGACARVCVLDGGRIVRQGTPAEMLRPAPRGALPLRAQVSGR
jgi:ABC-type bacteriocin/lantibiotic exporter with double-glycine peptidase domain